MDSNPTVDMCFQIDTPTAIERWETGPAVRVGQGPARDRRCVQMEARGPGSFKILNMLPLQYFSKPYHNVPQCVYEFALLDMQYTHRGNSGTNAIGVE